MRCRGDTRQCGLLNESGLPSSNKRGAIAASLASGGAKPPRSIRSTASVRARRCGLMSSPAHDVRQYCALRKILVIAGDLPVGKSPLRWRSHSSWTGNRPNRQKNNAVAHERNNPRFRTTQLRRYLPCAPQGSQSDLSDWSFCVKKYISFFQSIR